MHEVMSWLERGIPLSLLLDLATPFGPDSPAIARDELADEGQRRALADLAVLDAARARWAAADTA